MLLSPIYLKHFLLGSGVVAGLLPSSAAQDSDLVLTPPYDADADHGTLGPYPYRAYVTERDLVSPRTNFLEWDVLCDDGSLYFITPRGPSVERPGPMILDGNGDLVWTWHFDNDFGGQAYNLMVQKYKGEDYLTFWLGDDTVRGHGAGVYYMLDASYDIIHIVDAANGLAADLHEFLITDEDTALITIYDPIRYDLSDYSDAYTPAEDRKDAWIWDGVFQEIDIETGELMFQWRASEHVNVTHTLRLLGPASAEDDPFDWFHINSVQKDHLGNYIISARLTHSVMYIDGSSGEIIWTLGGRGNDFMDVSDGMALIFAWQHDARFVPDDAFSNLYKAPTPRTGVTTRLLTIFDNAAVDHDYGYGVEYSRGLLLELTYPTPGVKHASASNVGGHRPVVERDEEYEEYGDLNLEKLMAYNGTNPQYSVRVIQEYRNPNDIRSSSQGSMQLILQGPGQDAKLMVGYGAIAAWTEFSADGKPLCDVHFASETSWENGDVQSYRAYKFPWIGAPRSQPSVEIADDFTGVYVSWLGATEVAEWILQYSGQPPTADDDDADDETWLEHARSPKRDFEMCFDIAENMPPFGRSRYIRLVALDSKGSVLTNGVSRVLDRGVVGSYLSFLPEEWYRFSVHALFVLLACNILVVLLMFFVMRRVLASLVGKRAASRWRWRNGAVYRRVNEI